jgi:hypothetical protein
MNNQVVLEAVAAHNAELAQETQGRAIILISAISDNNSRISGCNDRIGQSRVALDAISKNVIDESTVFGGSLPANANQATIVSVIASANKARQFEIEQKSARLVAAVTAEQDAIRSIERVNAQLREELVKLESPAVTVSEIVG